MAQQSIKQARAFALIVALAVLAPADQAHAFCGFYVTGANSTLYANATEVVMMRDGTRTVLSIQNNYQGPPEAFALVVPVPIVLQKDNVKILPKDLFKRVDELGAPRLVEYWEMDPCRPQIDERFISKGGVPTSAAADGGAGPVRVEAQFTVGEYDVVVLGADDSSALETWLRQNKYNIPDGAAPVLAPYVASGMKFFVAKVDPARVTFQGNQAALSPLRFHYDTPDFSLPVRLGLLNSQGSQDLIVNILAAERYEVANYPNVTVPTNIRVQNAVRNDFASFYEALFSRVLEKNPKAVVTEYAWSSNSCDPCPTPPLTQQDLLTFGADVLQSQPDVTGVSRATGFTLTRLHARYSKDMLGEDLVFQQAPNIVGGRDVPGRDGNLDQKVTAAVAVGASTFQGRYVILHAWDKAITCQQPMRGFWGGPLDTPGTTPMTQASTNGALTGMAPRAGDLPALLAESLPALAVTARAPLEPLAPAAAGSGSSTGGKSAVGTAGQPAAGGDKAPAADGGTSPAAPASSKKSSGCAVAAGGDSSGLALTALALAWALRARRRHTSQGQQS